MKTHTACNYILCNVKAKVVWLCLTLCDPLDYTVHGILQARRLECVAFSFSRDLPNPGIKPTASALAGGFFITEPPGKPRFQILAPKVTHAPVAMSYRFISKL